MKKPDYMTSRGSTFTENEIMAPLGASTADERGYANPLLGFRVVFERSADPATIRPNRGSMFFEKADGAAIGWTDTDRSTHHSKYMGFRLVREEE